MANTPVTAVEHLIIVGKLEHNAASAETLMFGAFTIVSKCEPSLARAIFYTLDSFPGKRSLLRRASEKRTTVVENELIEKIIDCAETANNQRKQVAHGVITFSTDEPSNDFRVYSPKSQPQPKFPSKEWHSDLLQKSGKAGNGAKAAFEELCRIRGVSSLINFE